MCGNAATLFDDIAKRAGLSKGGIYFHFKSKRDIFDALHKRIVEANPEADSIGAQVMPLQEQIVAPVREELRIDLTDEQQALFGIEKLLLGRNKTAN